MRRRHDRDNLTRPMGARVLATILVCVVPLANADAFGAFSEPRDAHAATGAAQSPAPRNAPRPQPPVTTPPDGLKSNNPPSGARLLDGLDATPTEFEVLGLSLRLPAGSVTRAEGVGVNAAWIVTERTEAPRWIPRLSRLVASEPTSSPAKQVDALIKSVSERPAPDTVFSVRERSEFALGAQPAAKEGLKYGVSITDGCIDWSTTESLVREIHAALAPRFPAG